MSCGICAKCHGLGYVVDGQRAVVCKLCKPDSPLAWIEPVGEFRPPAETGRKDDGADGKGVMKDRWDLVDWRVLCELVKVLTEGAKQYGDNNWRLVIAAEGGPDRYFAACQRHIAAWRLGERKDPKSGLHPLAHAMASLLFLTSVDLEEDGGDE